MSQLPPKLTSTNWQDLPGYIPSFLDHLEEEVDLLKDLDQVSCLGLGGGGDKGEGVGGPGEHKLAGLAIIP